jgi:hypothetical protein
MQRYSFVETRGEGLAMSVHETVDPAGRDCSVQVFPGWQVPSHFTLSPVESVYSFF